eukprot:s1_g1512.t1
MRSAGVVGLASVVNILAGIIRLKVFALILGPAGVGLMGLFTNLLMLASTAAGMGVGSGSVRHVASVRDDQARGPAALQAVFLLGLSLAAVGGAGVYLLRVQLATHIIGDVSYSEDVGWIGLGVAASVAALVFTSMLQGLQRIGTFSKTTIAGNVLGTLMSILVIWQMGANGIYLAVICLPVSLALVAFAAIRGLPNLSSFQPVVDLKEEVRAIMSFGMVMLASAILLMGTMMIARSVISEELGLEAAGFFHAAWILSATYIGFALNAMGADFYPRITATIAQNEDASTLLNEQIYLALTLTAPLIVGVVAFAPLIIIVLYSAEFLPAAEVVRYHVVGDLFRVISVPMAYTFLAAGAKKRFLLMEVVWTTIYLSFLYTFLADWGVVAVGVGYSVGYALHMVFTALLLARTKRIVIKRSILGRIGLTMAIASSVLAASVYAAPAGYVAGTLAVAYLAYQALKHFLAVSGSTDARPQILVKLNSILMRLRGIRG